VGEKKQLGLLPKDGEATADGPGHQAVLVLDPGDHRLLAVGAHGLARDITEGGCDHHVGDCRRSGMRHEVR